MNPVLQIRQLKDQRAVVAEQAKQLNQKTVDEKRSLTAEEQVTWDKHFADINRLNNELRQLEADNELEGYIRGRREEIQAQTGQDPDEQRVAFNSFIRGGIFNDDGHLVGAPAEVRQHYRFGTHSSNDFGASQKRANNPQSDVTGNLGGYIVPQGFYAQVQEAMKYYNGMMLAGPTVIDTAMGNDLPVPTANDTSIVGEVLAENTTIATQEITFGQVTLKAYKMSSKLILLPIELAQDSGVDVEALITKFLGIRLGRLLNQLFSTGTGSSQPKGVTLDTVLGKQGASGQIASVIYDDLVDLKYSVDRAYRVNGKWMMTDTTLKGVLKLKDLNDRPLILDYLTTLQADEPEKILGQSLIINNDLASLGGAGSPNVGNQCILYGDFSAYWVRRVMAMLLLRLTERYADAGQIGFIGFIRQDGRMVDAGTHPIKYYQCANS